MEQLTIEVPNKITTDCGRCKEVIVLKRDISIKTHAEYKGKCICGFNNVKGQGFFKQ